MAAHLPPVGNPITRQLLAHPAEILASVFSGFDVFLYRSGTMALGASLVATATTARDRGLKGALEVLMPAYACPDLVSAVVYAGLKPILVDFEADRPWMDLDMLRQRLSPQTVAVIAVSFLGVSERLGQIRDVIGGREVCLIEDSAQYFSRKEATPPHWTGDLIVLSFGRGKPVSLLGGGAILCRKGVPGLYPAPALPLAAEAAALIFEKAGPGLSWQYKIALYNQLLRPSIYGLLRTLPFLHIGETRYKPLSSIMSAEGGTPALLAANILQFQQRERQQQGWVADLIARLDSARIVDLAKACDCDAAEPLLRYPLLLSSSESRDRLLADLQAKGLGPSGMYPAILPHLPGLSPLLTGKAEFPNAERFAATLLTLPTHAGVGLPHIKVMADVFEESL